MADYSKAIEINPSDANTYVSRGLIYYYEGKYNHAIADYKREIEYNPDFEYARLWLLIASRYISKEKAKEFLKEMEDYTNRHPSTEWVRTISRYYMGNITGKKFFEKASRGKNEQQILGHLCEAYYYAGEEMLWEGDKANARKFFQKALATGKKDFDEYSLSKVMLKKIKKM
ncbi:MAG: tetratricopeptide repeat protein [Nitrospiraceae bacterium]|nr:tetratricopeptide repeat protein [Nitrospiraceae bacterium]